MEQGSERPVRPRKPLRAVVFDLDDTLVVSTVDFPKFKAMVIDRIEALGDDRSMYSPSETIVIILDRFEARMRAKGASNEDVRRMLAEMDRIMDGVELERVDETEPLPGAAETLAYLRERGVRIGVLTRGCPEYARRAMVKAGISHLVDAVEARNSEARPKPYPDSYVRMVEALGVEKAETVFVGDHAIDGRCASNAGVPFIGVRTGDVHDQALVEAGAFVVLEDVRELREHLENLI
jgi:HAD superfamily hydrolase (TIGR01549 family)